MNGYLPLGIQRNSHYWRQWRFVDSTGEPIDLTGATFEMDVKHSAGDPGVVLTSFDVALVDAADGRINVYLDGSTLAAVPGEQDSVTLAYDCIAVQSGYRLLVARGPLTLLPGVS